MGRPHELMGFAVHDRVRCPSKRVAVIDRLRPDGKLDAHYDDGEQVTLDPRQLEHANDGGWDGC